MSDRDSGDDSDIIRIVESPEERKAGLLGLPVSLLDTAVVVLLVIAADVCLYAAPGGTGFGILAILCAGALPVIAWKKLKNLPKLLLVTLLLVAAVSVWNHWWLLTLVGAVATIAYAVKLYRPDWKITEVIWVIPQTLLLAPLRVLGHVHRSTAPAAAPVGRRRRFFNKALLAPAAACALFALIFIAANPVLELMADKVSTQIGDWIEVLSRLFSVSRVLTWAGWVLLFAALVRPPLTSLMANLTSGWRENLEPSAPDGDRGDDLTAAVSTLISVNVLFLAFNALDSVYLYFKAALPENISYSEYSHRGCFWLTVALALSTVVIGAIFRNRLNRHPRRKVLHVLSYAWVVQNAFLAIGALRRLQLYIDYNGMTRLRIVGICGVLLVIAGLALMVWKVHRTKSFAWLIRRDLLAFWIALIALALVPRDLICSNYNVAQVMSGNHRPLTLLHGQPMSPESYPPLIPLLDYKDRKGDEPGSGEMIREGIRDMLGRKLLDLRATKADRWSAWQGSHAWALERLEAVGDRLDLTPRPDMGRSERSLREYTRKWW